jgi:hypothetical protein
MRSSGQECGLASTPSRATPCSRAGSFQQRVAVVADRGYDRRLADTELSRHLSHQVSVLPDPATHLGAGPLGQMSRTLSSGQRRWFEWPPAVGDDIDSHG